ncbi:MAG: hypothetical protein ACHREM_26070 [Polyangiales bacterium]
MKLALGICSLAFVAALGGAVTACSTTTTTVPGVYEQCSGACDNGTACTVANVTTDGFVGSFCTAGCDPTSAFSCPSDGTGVSPVCVALSSDPTNGLCYGGCPSGSSAQCPGSELCSTGGGENFCVP